MPRTLRTYLSILAICVSARGSYAQSLSCPVASPAAQFNFTTIDVPGAQSTFASGINNSGKVVGSFTDSAGIFHGYSDDVDNDAFRQIDFPGSTSTLGANTNNRGNIVGSYGDANSQFHGFLLRHGVFSTIDFPSAILTSSAAINDRRMIVGAYGTADSSTHGYLLDENGFTTLDDPDEGILTGANGPFTITNVLGINDRGIVVGQFFDSNFNSHGFLFSDGSFQTIDFPGAASTFPVGLNNEAVIVGGYLDSQFVEHGYIQEKNRFTTVDFPGATGTILEQNNSRGLIVGEFTDSAGNTHSFLLRPNHGGGIGPGDSSSIGCQSLAQSNAAPLQPATPLSCHTVGAKGTIICSRP
ncbi:MAG TPA: hypothetical protein VKY85_08210 [Candidatus Angelobacter sp.]|nr:hypothetical protein [Candidatus Angelobacter sp.]